MVLVLTHKYGPSNGTSTSSYNCDGLIEEGDNERDDGVDDDNDGNNRMLENKTKMSISIDIICWFSQFHRLHTR